MIEYLTTFQSCRDFDGMCPCVYRNGARMSILFGKFRFVSLFVTSDLLRIHQARFENLIGIHWKLSIGIHIFLSSFPSFLSRSRQNVTKTWKQPIKKDPNAANARLFIDLMRWFLWWCFSPIHNIMHIAQYTPYTSIHLKLICLKYWNDMSVDGHVICEIHFN